MGLVRDCTVIRPHGLPAEPGDRRSGAVVDTARSDRVSRGLRQRSGAGTVGEDSVSRGTSLRHRVPSNVTGASPGLRRSAMARLRPDWSRHISTPRATSEPDRLLPAAPCVDGFSGASGRTGCMMPGKGRLRSQASSGTRCPAAAIEGGIGEADAIHTGLQHLPRRRRP